LAISAALTTIAAQGPRIDWPQWGQNPQHQGFVDVAGQNLNTILANITYDPNVPAEMASTGGELLAHYQAPLLHENDVFMEFKGGTFTDADHWETQTWSERRYHWENGQLVEKWSFLTNWKPEPNGPGNGQSSKQDRLGLGGWEPVFHAVLANDSVYVPDANGTITKLAMGDGSVVARIDPGYPATTNTTTFVAGPLSADSAGNVYFNAIQLDNTHPWGDDYTTDIPNSWLVKVTPEDTAQKVSYKSLVSGAPTTCTTTYNATTDTPWPPAGGQPAPTGPCGSQRVALNVAPPIAPDGTIYTVSRAHFRSRYGYVLAVNSNLTPKWQASLRGHLADGCGVLLPDDGGVDPGIGCSANASQYATGIDPATGQLPAGRVIDQSSSSPSVAPDGSVLYGSYSRYNFARGHLFKFSAAGVFQGTFDFGWDTTPAIYPHGGSYSIAIKDNHYDGNCCPGAAAPPPGPYFITQLSATLGVEWKFESPTRTGDHLNGFEWCINAPAIDRDGVVYDNSEDGFVYAINQGGTEKQRKFLKEAVGAAYTPLAIGADGKLYTENDGVLFVIGN
jgi:hypothetical protein